MNPVETFKAKVPALMARTIEDFKVTPMQAAGIWGNAGHESAGFTQLQERNPIAGRGGLGFFQWTGPRRKSFERYLGHTNQRVTQDAANYSYFWRECSGHEPGFDYRSAIALVKRTDSLKGAVRAFEGAYERAGVKHYDSRDRWSVIALASYHGGGGTDEVKRIQEKLASSGYDPGPIDGIMGPRTLKAIAAALGI